MSRPITYNPSALCLTQKKIFWRMWVTRQFLVPIDFFHTTEGNGDHQLFGYAHSTASFMFNRRKKLIQVWNNLRVCMMTEFSFLGEKVRLHLLLFDTFSHVDSSYFSRYPHIWEFSMREIVAMVTQIPQQKRCMILKLTSLWAGHHTLLIDLNQVRRHIEFNTLENKTVRDTLIGPHL